MPYAISLGDETFNTDDLTLAEAETIEDELGVSWLAVNPLLRASHCKAVLLAFAARSQPREEALTRVNGLTVEQALGAIRLVDDDLPTEYEDGLPKGEGAASTATS